MWTPRCLILADGQITAPLMAVAGWEGTPLPVGRLLLGGGPEVDQARLAPPHQKDRDVSYLDDDGAPQMALTRQTAIGKLQERMELRLQRGAQLNLPYDLGFQHWVCIYQEENR